MALSEIPSLFNFLDENAYPLFNNMSEEEKFSVFSTSNRKFLLNWAINLLDAVITEDPNNKELINWLNDCGICESKNQAIKFLNGNGNLSPQDELLLLYRTFRFISCVKIGKAVKNAANNVAMPVLENFLKLDINLFPDLPPLSEISVTERNKNLEEIDHRIIELQVSETENLNIQIIPELLAKNNNEYNLEQNLEKLKQFLNKLHEFVEPSSSGSHQNAHNIENNCIDLVVTENFENTVESYNEYLGILLKGLKDLKAIIISTSKWTSSSVTQECTDRSSALIDELIQQISE